MERVLRMRDRRRALRVVRGSMWRRALIEQAMIVVLLIYSVLRPLEKMLRNKS